MSQHSGYLRSERRRGLPIVFVDRPPTGLAADSVVSANFEGALQAVRHLAAHGHRRIAFVGDVPATLYTRRERWRGYRQALDEAGIRYSPELVEQGHHETDEAAAAYRPLRIADPPTAIFAGNNLACMGVVMALTRARRHDVAIVGFDDFVFAYVLHSGITVVAQDVE